MKIELTEDQVLGKKGARVDVVRNLAKSLVKRGLAKYPEKDLSELTVKQLQEKAKEIGIAYSGLKKAELIELL